MSDKPQYKPFPKLENGNVDVETVKKMFMEGDDLSWDNFCVINNFNKRSSRNHCPVSHWRKEKRNRLIKERGEELSDLFFEQKYRWNKEVAKTLNEYPKAIDKAFMLLQGRLNQFAQAYVELAQNKNPGPFNKISTHELVSISDAMAKIQAAKYKSLLLNDFAVKQADQEHEKTIKDINESVEPFQIEIMNLGKTTAEDLQKLKETWIDQPEGEDENKAD